MITSVTASITYTGQNIEKTPSISSRHMEVFEKIDSNGDGGIDIRELESSASMNNNSTLFSMMKSKLSSDGAAAMMDEIDVNKDGVIDSIESDRFISNYERGVSDRKPVRVPTQTLFSVKELSKTFDFLDTNKDGVVSSDDLKSAFENAKGIVWDAGMNVLLENMDSNDDASISKDEFTAFFQKMKSVLDAKNQTASPYETVSTVRSTEGTFINMYV